MRIDKPKLIAHRGDTTHFEENTLPAFSSALDRKADGIELDVQLVEGKLIIVHDYLFDREKTYPLLMQVLELAKGKGSVEIEIKSMNTDCLEKLSEELKEYPHLEIELTTSVYALLPHIKRVLPSYKLGVIFQPQLFQDWMTTAFVEEMITSWMKLSSAQVAHIPFKQTTSKLVEHLHTNKILVHSHISRSAGQVKDYQYLKEIGVDQCTFDDIELIGQVRN